MFSWHTSVLTWLPFFIIIILMISFIYINSGVADTPILAKRVAEPPSRYHFWYLFKLQGAHYEIYKTTGVYIGKKNCVQVTNIWSFFGLYQLSTHIILCFQWLHMTDCVLIFFLFLIFFFFFFMKGSILVNMLFWYMTGIHVTFGSKQAYKIY
jgi:hypothetical protein